MLSDSPPLKFFILAVLISIISFPLSSLSSASSQLGLDDSTTKLEYQAASLYSYLSWYAFKGNRVAIKIMPIANYSGIPFEQREENATYYEHGKIPLAVNALFADLVQSSRILNVDKLDSDFKFLLTINQYQLPFDYAPDDIWWKELNDDVDRWMVAAKKTKVSLTLKIVGDNRQIQPWSRSIETTLAQCDVNSLSQPLTATNNQNQVLLEYGRSTPGQAFIAASNFLILQAIHHLNNQHGQAQVVHKSENELLLRAKNDSFVIGEKLGLYHQNQYSSQSLLPAGQVQIIKTFQNQAVAYPVNLRIDQIREGDWVELSTHYPITLPKPKFVSKNQCAQVIVAEK